MNGKKAKKIRRTVRMINQAYEIQGKGLPEGQKKHIDTKKLTKHMKKFYKQGRLKLS